MDSSTEKYDWMRRVSSEAEKVLSEMPDDASMVGRNVETGKACVVDVNYLYGLIVGLSLVRFADEIPADERAGITGKDVITRAILSYVDEFGQPCDTDDLLEML